ncbi:hypothetical protein BZL29_8395 [Mycobacterium kansasii]|uniref:Uncharacterized protein n=1 Tax=Mycobacterium kansasii TaxID=1768 RepID=A0A1V3WAW6_MYCKA|nr:hypothetical protein BZL29_8395 [Mycobacterium kansasii]
MVTDRQSARQVAAGGVVAAPSRNAAATAPRFLRTGLFAGLD